MIYEYIITAFKVIVGVVTNNRIALASLVALGIMLIWIFFSLLFSFQGKFTSRVRKLNVYVSRNGITGDAKQGLEDLLVKMPSEFQKGYKKFERNPRSLPSDNIKRFDSLDIELSGGVFNQNKSVLKTYTNFIFVTLLVFSLAILSTEDALTGYMLAEAAIIPLLFLIIAKLVYYVYTAIRQYQYKTAVEEFNYLLENLDKVAMDTYGYSPSNISVQKEEESVAELVPSGIPVVEEEIDEVKEVEEVSQPKNDEMIENVQEEETIIEDQPVEDLSVEPEIQEVSSVENNDPEIEYVEVIPVNAEEEPVVDEDSETDEVSFVETKEDQESNELPEPVEVKTESKEVIEEPAEVKVEANKIELNNREYKDNFKPDFASLLEEEVVQKRGRGRPRKEVSETGELVIKNDKEFEDALVRAEKLMRKNEEPLSASQTKRIEKQIKELVDAMTKYKEGK